jgi:hypothetical protein
MSSRIGAGVAHLVALPVPLDGCSPPYSPIELIDENTQMSVDHAFRGENFLELAVVGRPAHPFRLGHVVAYAAITAELAAQFERAPQSAIVRGFSLRAIDEAVGLAGREGEGVVWQIEVRRPPARPGADEPPPSAPKGLRRRRELDPIIGLALLPVISGCRVF